jgi:uncharacterized protein YecE (DUF72 family)
MTATHTLAPRHARRLQAGRIAVGCSGWSYADWRGRLYPRGLPTTRWLERYADVFDTVEVNATFYRLPATASVRRWAAATPAGFCFAVKASRYLTHVRRLRGQAGVSRFTARLRPLEQAGKLGPVLWQLPEQFHRDDLRLADLLDRVPPGRHAFEFRHASWFCDDVYELLRGHDAALVLADTPERDQPQDVTTASWSYVRLHRGRRGRRGNYSDRELASWAERLRGLRGDAYVYFNNDWEGFAVENALRLRALLDPRFRDRSRG